MWRTNPERISRSEIDRFIILKVTVTAKTFKTMLVAHLKEAAASGIRKTRWQG